MLIISHRGLRGNGFENTLEAFGRAVEIGVDGIETDVRLSGDGQAVLYHDRLAPDGREINGVSRSELSALAGCAVPTLTEALEQWDQLLWVLELKTPNVLDAAVQALQRFQATRRCLVISFWHTVIRRVREQLDVECGLSVRHRPLSFPASGLAGGPAELSLRTVVWDYEFLDEEMIAEARTGGWRNIAFGPETPAEHRRCVELDLDGVITDSPQYLLALRSPADDPAAVPA